MAGLRVIWVGRTQKGFVQDGVAFYQGRIQPFQPIECLEVRAAGHSGRSPEQALAAEGDAILRRLAPDDAVVLLDERGDTPDTRQFAALLQALLEGSPRPPTFVIGGGLRGGRRAGAPAARPAVPAPGAALHALGRGCVLAELVCALSSFAR